MDREEAIERNRKSSLARYYANRDIINQQHKDYFNNVYYINNREKLMQRTKTKYEPRTPKVKEPKPPKIKEPKPPKIKLPKVERPKAPKKKSKIKKHEVEVLDTVLNI
jgi:hypothetical protein